MVFSFEHPFIRDFRYVLTAKGMLHSIICQLWLVNSTNLQLDAIAKQNVNKLVQLTRPAFF